MGNAPSGFILADRADMNAVVIRDGLGCRMVRRSDDVVIDLRDLRLSDVMETCGQVPLVSRRCGLTELAAALARKGSASHAYAALPETGKLGNPFSESWISRGSASDGAGDR